MFRPDPGRHEALEAALVVVGRRLGAPDRRLRSSDRQQLLGVKARPVTCSAARRADLTRSRTAAHPVRTWTRSPGAHALDVRTLTRSQTSAHPVRTWTHSPGRAHALDGASRGARRAGAARRADAHALPDLSSPRTRSPGARRCSAARRADPHALSDPVRTWTRSPGAHALDVDARRRGPWRSTFVNGRLRHTGKDPFQHAPPCVVSRVGFYVLHTSSACASAVRRTCPADCMDGWPR